MNRIQEKTEELLTLLEDRKTELALDKKHYGALTHYLLLNQRYNYQDGLSFGEFKEHSEESFHNLEDFLQTFYNYTPDPNIDAAVRMISQLDVEGLLESFKNLLNIRKVPLPKFPTLDAAYHYEKNTFGDYEHHLEHDDWKMTLKFSPSYNQLTLHNKNSGKTSSVVFEEYDAHDFISFLRVFAGYFSYLADLEEQNY